jgi:hypothetical protein
MHTPSLQRDQPRASRQHQRARTTAPSGTNRGREPGRGAELPPLTPCSHERARASRALPRVTATGGRRSSRVLLQVPSRGVDAERGRRAARSMDADSDHDPLDPERRRVANAHAREVDGRVLPRLRWHGDRRAAIAHARARALVYARRGRWHGDRRAAIAHARALAYTRRGSGVRRSSSRDRARTRSCTGARTRAPRPRCPAIVEPRADTRRGDSISRASRQHQRLFRFPRPPRRFFLT